MGGTFNPIHFGHLLLAETAYYDFNLDSVLVMPTKSPSYKKISSSITNEDRIRMVELAIENNAHFELSTVEFDRGGSTYTVDTLEHLTSINQEVDYYFIMGADSLYHLEAWKNAQRVLELATILVASRDNVSSSAINSQIDYINDKYDSRIYHLNSPNFEISSNDIRDRVENNRSIKYFLPEKVEEYIKEKRLYQS